MCTCGRSLLSSWISWRGTLAFSRALGTSQKVNLCHGMHLIFIVSLELLVAYTNACSTLHHQCNDACIGQKGVQFEWAQASEKAFETINTQLVSSESCADSSTGSATHSHHWLVKGCCWRSLKESMGQRQPMDP
jgi:hypothetical protein